MRGGKLRPVCPQCGWAHFPDPKVAAAVLVVRDAQILLVQRANPPKRNQWTFPAGFVDAGEDPAQAAIRECHEETGLNVEITELVDVVSVADLAGAADILILYHARIIGGELQAGDDAAQAGFFSRKGLPPLAFVSTKKILQKFLNQSAG